MGGKATDTECSFFFEDFCSFGKSACSINDVVDDNRLFSVNITDQVHRANLTCSFSLFDDHSQRSFFNSNGR